MQLHDISSKSIILCNINAIRMQCNDLKLRNKDNINYVKQESFIILLSPNQIIVLFRFILNCDKENLFP